MDIIEPLKDFDRAITSGDIAKARHIFFAHHADVGFTDHMNVSSYSAQPNPAAWQLFLDILKHYCSLRSSDEMCRLEDMIRNEALHGNHYDALIKQLDGFVPMTVEARTVLLERLVEEEDLPSEDCLALCMRIKNDNIDNPKEVLAQFVEEITDAAWGDEHIRDCSFLNGALKQAGYDSGLAHFDIEMPVSSLQFGR